MTGLCSIDGCTKAHLARGWCNIHYKRWRLYGSPLYRQPTTEERFWSWVDKSGECWLWTGATNYGYGVFSINNRMRRAHRYAYQLLVGPIPDGLVLDHLCRVHNCVNPDHLEPVTDRVNIMRGVGFSARHANRKHCLKGHPFDAVWQRNGYRYCTACEAERQRAWNKARRGRKRAS